jgi:hypothetical protein
MDPIFAFCCAHNPVHSALRPHQEDSMKARSLILAAIGALAVTAAAPAAQANGYHQRYGGDYGRGYERPHWRPPHHYRHYRPYGYYAPPPVYYAPRPYAYAPPAVYFGFGVR